MAKRLSIGILGDPQRGSVWEQYLRPHPTVSQVVITEKLSVLGSVDACIILDEQDPLHAAEALAKEGVHLFLVGRLPSDLPALIRLQHTIEEIGSVLQFSNWAYFNPLSLWMMEQIPRPRIIHCHREIDETQSDAGVKLDNLWIEDLALVLRWIDSGIHRLETQYTRNGDLTLSRNTYVQFDNGTSASLFHTLFSRTHRHLRYANDDKTTIEADILGKSVHMVRSMPPDRIFETKTFSQELAANQAVSRFLKSIQMRQRAEYGIFDMVRLVKAIVAANSSIVR